MFEQLSLSSSYRCMSRAFGMWEREEKKERRRKGGFVDRLWKQTTNRRVSNVFRLPFHLRFVFSFYFNLKTINFSHSPCFLNSFGTS